MDITFAKTSFGEKLKSMIKVDFKRMFTMPLVYIMAAISLAMPILILVMTTMLGGETAGEGVAEGAVAMVGFTNVWQTIGSVSGSDAGMDLTGMCNINMLYFLVVVFVCIFVADDFKSGYAKNLFTVRAKKTDYVVSKSVVGFLSAAIMFAMFFIGAMIGGAIANISFDTVGFNAGNVVACMLSKIFMTAVFVGIALLLGVVAKQKLWLSILGSFGASMLLFTMISITAPLDAGFLNVIMCLAGGAMFAAGLGVASNVILNKTNLV